MERRDGYYSRKVSKSCPTRSPKAEREGNDMSDREFAVIATRLIWGESEAEPTPQETIKSSRTSPRSATCTYGRSRT